ncbi:hypothetical protein OG455_11755 [Kitasatospora sp. NBC_01287]|uniref:hypothetical protein n=1 Tax=Kitasatospora sp. NBC_01287 TaxID=2903573 RepID=UPI00225A21ED|nr:hypothetical protein [Kitasatospora sp. NBC_01287]MCX4746190.1 hypothetical protein [Kitasatospora sp. NBC_01287]
MTLLISIGAGLLATVPLRSTDPFSTRAALFMCTACPLVMVCVVASEPALRWAARRRARKAGR